MDLEKLESLKAEKVSDMEALMTLAGDEDRDLTEDEQAKFDALDTECVELDMKIVRAKTLQARKSEIEEASKGIGRKVVNAIDTSVAETETKLVIPAYVKREGAGLKSFKGPDADEKAYKAGMWYMAVAGSRKAREFCEAHGMPLQWHAETGHQEIVNTKGGYLVPDQLDNSIVDLRLQYGVFRRNARIVTMTSDTVLRPRRTGGLDAYFVGESAAGTQKTKSWDQLQLTAKKLMVLTKMSSELREDAIISIADDLTGEIAYAFAKKEDTCGFNGTGISTHGGITGIVTKIGDICGVTAGGGLILASGDTWPEIVLADLHRVVSVCPSYARMGAKWYCSPTFNDSILQSLQTAKASTVKEIADGGIIDRCLGYPVELVEVMKTATGVSEICALFGNMAQAADFGDRRKTTIAFSDVAVVDSESVFEQDEIAVRGTERFDINVHDVGTATVAGPVVAFMTAAS